MEDEEFGRTSSSRSPRFVLCDELYRGRTRILVFRDGDGMSTLMSLVSDVLNARQNWELTVYFAAQLATKLEGSNRSALYGDDDTIDARMVT